MVYVERAYLAADANDLLAVGLELAVNPGGLQAIHFWHPDVHEHHIVMVLLFKVPARPLLSWLSGQAQPLSHF